jgi:hypothetical protein
VKKTIVCEARGVEACVVCMVDGFHAWLWQRKQLKQQLKREWRDTPVAERFELGGES